MGIREANIPVRGNPVEAQKGELMWQRPTVGLWVGAEVACWEGMMEESWALIADTGVGVARAALKGATP